MANRVSTSPGTAEPRRRDAASRGSRGEPLVHVLRHDEVESIHLGHVAVTDVRGRVLAWAGDPDLLIFPRSSFKPFQAVPLLESGAFARSGLGADSLAVIVGSHSGTDEHVALVLSILAKAGLDESALRCGSHTPFDEATATALRARGDAPGPLRHNCSGKHAGMLLLARELGASIDDYLDPGHHVQRAIFARFAEIIGEPWADAAPAIDGCSAPTPRMPLRTLAKAFALLAGGVDATGRPAPALTEIRDAMRSHPHLVAGEGRLDTQLMRAAPELVAKVGAEAVHATGVLPTTAGIAVKVGDGSTRALAPAVIAVLVDAGALEPKARLALAPMAEELVRSHAGLEVGAVRGVARLKREAP